MKARRSVRMGGKPRLLGGKLAAVRLPIRTRRLILRAPVSSDVESVYRALRDETMGRFVSGRPRPYTRVHATDFVSGARRKMRRGEMLNLIGVDARTGELSVAVGLYNLNWKDRHGEIGYWVPRRLWGQGLATEAVIAVCAEVFRHTNIHRIEATVEVDNEASARVLTKAGFVKEGTRRHAHLHGTSWTDADLYALLNEGSLAPSGTVLGNRSGRNRVLKVKKVVAGVRTSPP